MAEQQASRKSRQSKEDDDDTTSPQRSENEKGAEKVEQAEKNSAVTEEVLDDIDRALKEQCGFPHDAAISDEEFNARADALVRDYVQKPGQ